jgi:hypothetical protein
VEPISVREKVLVFFAYSSSMHHHKKFIDIRKDSISYISHGYVIQFFRPFTLLYICIQYMYTSTLAFDSIFR